MQNPNGRHSTPSDTDRNFTHEDDRYGRGDRQIHDDGGFRSREESWRQTDQYGQGQSGYNAGRYQGDTSPGFQSRNQGYPGTFEDNQRGGPMTDERWQGRGGSAYWQPREGERTGYGPAQQGYGYGAQQFQGTQPRPQVYDREPDWASRRRHNVGNYGYGSDSQSHYGGGMYDQNQGFGMQGQFGGHYGGYGHVGGYGAEGGGMGHQDMPQRHTNPGMGMPDRMPGGHRGKGPKNFTRSDERIREAVSEALEIHDHIDASQIEVLVKNGEVVLSGTVDSRDMKRLAEDVATSVSGVRDVQNQIKVGSDRDRHERTEMKPIDNDSRKARA